MNNVGAFQPYIPSRAQPEKFPGRVYHKILTLNINVAFKRNRPGSGLIVFGIIFHLQLLKTSFGVIRNGHLQWIQHNHHTRSDLIQFFPDT